MYENNLSKYIQLILSFDPGIKKFGTSILNSNTLEIVYTSVINLEEKYKIYTGKSIALNDRTLPEINYVLSKILWELYNLCVSSIDETINIIIIEQQPKRNKITPYIESSIFQFFLTIIEIGDFLSIEKRVIPKKCKFVSFRVSGKLNLIEKILRNRTNIENVNLSGDRITRPFLETYLNGDIHISRFLRGKKRYNLRKKITQLCILLVFGIQIEYDIADTLLQSLCFCDEEMILNKIRL